MRIVVVNNFFPPRVGGSSHLADALARGYAERGHDVLVVTASYGDAPAREVRDGLRIVRLPSVSLPETRLAVSFDISFASRPSLGRRLAALLDDFRPDVIHQHGQFFDLTWATGMYARRHQVPVLLSVHTRLENPKAHYHGVFRVLDATMVKPALRVSQPRVVVMDVLMDEYIKGRYKGAYRGLDYIPVGVDPAWTAGGDGSAARAALGLDPQVPMILSLGHVIPLRDRVALVEAMPDVLAEFPDAKLVVVGKVYYDAFEQRADELGIRSSVISVGAIPKAQVPDFLAAADVESHEQGIGLGTATLEAMAAGVPVVAPAREDNFPTIPLRNREDLWFVPPGDVAALGSALREVLRDRVRGRAVGANAQAVVHESFSLEHVLDQHLDVLEKMVADRG
ncbi:glycosyltransferase family 4 protein [Cellulomonas xylanilytica]|uniref:D-inositol 3-phosphate glycosyltransferase n=1 Tax=Cellulomonas xylanilytica TaxID=233583 RepID=A0A510V4C9_9CELL|nr:glycosyltransferase family 4 protein [Cellulomonas xylanilytica]GEK21656.1 glucosyltransferase [Cellulomonas xylanilytica]